MRIPRTPADFAKLNCWAWQGLSDAQIFRRMEKEWRSEVTTLAGRLHCAVCIQPITIHVCTECGQTFHGGDRT